MLRQSLPSHVCPSCVRFAVVAVRIDRDAASRCEFAPHLDVFRRHQCNQILHDDVHAILVEVAVVAETEKVKLQRFTFDHDLSRDVGNVDGRKIGLSRHRAQACEFGAVEFHKVIIVRMLVRKSLKDFRIVVLRIFSLLVAQLGDAVQIGFISACCRVSGACANEEPTNAGTDWPMQRLTTSGRNGMANSCDR